MKASMFLAISINMRYSFSDANLQEKAVTPTMYGYF